MDAALLGLLGSLLPATVFAVVAPRTGGLFLRWGHSMVWLLLAAACAVLVIGGSAAGPVAQPIAIAGLAVYLVFVGALRRHRAAQASVRSKQTDRVLPT